MMQLLPSHTALSPSPVRLSPSPNPSSSPQKRLEFDSGLLPDSVLVYITVNNKYMLGKVKQSDVYFLNVFRNRTQNYIVLTSRTLC